MIEKINPKKAGLPSLKVKILPQSTYAISDLSSHARAKEALTFGLQLNKPGCNVFVVGENHSGRLSSTLAVVKKHLEKLTPGLEWVYLNNFEKPEQPLPFAFPAGQAERFSVLLTQSIKKFVDKYINALQSAYFSTKSYTAQQRFKKYIESEIESIRSFSKQHHFDIHWGQDGTITPVYLKEKEDPHFKSVSSDIWDRIVKMLQELDHKADEKKTRLNEKLNAEKMAVIQNYLSPLLAKVNKTFEGVAGLTQWIEDLGKNITANIAVFEQGNPAVISQLLTRYAVNILTQCKKDECPPLVVEPTPSYENLFGQVMYEISQQGHHTDHRMVRPGSLHKANGGILVLRADSLAEHPDSWRMLKAALRDKEIRIEELKHNHSLPLLNAPRPKPIPLDIKVILIGAPAWYHFFFMNDPDFQTYFKIKAEIDNSMELTPRNTQVAASLLQRHCQQHNNVTCTPEALAYILGYSTRFVENRRKLPAQFEKLQDIVDQAAAVALRKGRARLEVEDIRFVADEMERRSQRSQEQMHELINKKVLHIETQGEAIGQVNALTVFSGSDTRYGCPIRLTATTAMGSNGIVNIERQIKMSGPLQQKSVFILEGFLQHRFAQDFPLCITAMLTFEQSYTLIDGDSASLAEACAILSSLAGVPIQQGIAITGSMNQFGQAQAVGGVPHKVEAFYDICKQNGLTGKQGVIIPRANTENLVLKGDLVADMEKGNFHLWTVDTVEDALSLLLGKKIFSQAALANQETVFRTIYSKLKLFASYNKTRS